MHKSPFSFVYPLTYKKYMIYYFNSYSWLHHLITFALLTTLVKKFKKSNYTKMVSLIKFAQKRRI
jgi:hypothetical protein